MNIRTIGHQSQAIQGHYLGGSHSNCVGHKTFTQTPVNLKKNTEFESYVLFGGTSTQETASQMTLRGGEGKGGVRLYRSFAKMAGCLNIKRLLLMKENQISQAMEFSTFLCMERYKSLGLVKSFLTYASQLSWASILCFFHILSFLGAHPRE